MTQDARTLTQLSELLKQADALIRTCDFAKAHEIAQIVVADAVCSRDDDFHARALNTLSISYWKRGISSPALEQAQKALVLAQKASNKKLEARILSNIATIYVKQAKYGQAIDYFTQTLVLDEALHDRQGESITNNGLGVVYRLLGDYQRALGYFHKSLSIEEELDNKKGISLALGNIGLVYSHLEERERALHYFNNSLALAEEIGDKDGVVHAYGNIGNVHHVLAEYDRALQYFRLALAISEDMDNQQSSAALQGNIANVYLDVGEYDKGLEYLQQAMQTNQRLGNRRSYSLNVANLASIYSEESYSGYDPARSEELLLQAIELSKEIESKELEYGHYQQLSALYKKLQRWEECQNAFETFYELEREVINDEVKTKVESLHYERDRAEREKKLAVERARHEATQQLLYNVLPPEIARRMISGEQLIAESLPSVTVLFADIVRFTQLAERVSAQEIVSGLDRIFSAFDELADVYDLEKIKTIGDSYMVVAGAPIQRDDHAAIMARMALDMQEVIKSVPAISTDSTVQIRIGIHTGSVVAGVIGRKKYAYDLWGDAVNTASRMESHGEAGKIHCSEAFVKAAGNEFVFRLRGEIDVKGKGKMKTFFLEYE